MLAAEGGKANVVTLFLDKEDIQNDCRDQNNRTALMLAHEKGHKVVVELLERAGALGEILGPSKRRY